MSIDLTEVLQLFIEESSENLDVMESGLLDLEVGNLDSELLNSIFRAAHSIKGGAGIFKLEHIIHFAHTVEALLDEIRNEQHIVTQAVIDLLLEAVDVLRLMIKSLDTGGDNPDAEMLKCQAALEQMLKTPLGQPFLELIDYETPATIATDSVVEQPPVLEASTVVASTSEGETNTAVSSKERAHTVTVEVVSPAEESVLGWHIHFRPYPNLLKTGNDPINLFRELGQLGDLTATPEISQLPDFKDINPHLCYISWTLTLRGNIARTAVEELFEWVEDECDLDIIPLQQHTADLTDTSAVNTIEIASEERDTLSNHAVDEVMLQSPTHSPDDVMSIEAPLTSPHELPPSTPVSVDMGDKSDSETQTSASLPTTVEEAKVSITTVDDTLPNALKLKPNASAEPEPALASKVTTQLTSKAVQTNSTKPEKTSSSNEANSIRVSIDKIDDLINIVGELVITQSMLDEISDDAIDEAKLDQLRGGLAQLKRNTRELQESVMRIRMLPISVSFNRFPRLVHDLSKQLGKKVELKLSGEHTELDKTVLEKMSDPLVHLVRNALDHGIESPEQRVAAGKPATGILHLHAFHQGGNIIIQISDDGAGFNLAKIRQKAIEKRLLEAEEMVTEERLHEFIFHPGFSTTEQVSDLSGRGVGMDVVRKNIRALGGNIEVKSIPGQGTIFNIQLPLTLAILDGQLVRVGKEIYIISLLSIVESLRAMPHYISSLAGQAEVYKLRDEYIPIMRLYQLFHVEPDLTDLTQGLLVIVEGEGQKIGLFVDELLSQQQIVIKSLETNYKQLQGISGATILGDGSVALILDIVGLIQYFHANYRQPRKLTEYAGAA